MMGTRWCVARSAARRVLEESWASGLPVDVESVAQARGAKIETLDNFPSGHFGALARRGNEVRILVSAACPNDGHRRFTIGHEIGHLVIEGHLDVLFADGDVAFSIAGWSRKNPPHEVEANVFASELLLPARLARDFVDSAGEPRIEAIAMLADHAGTSLSAAAIKYATVSDEPVAVLLSKDRAVEWVALSGAFDEHRWANTWAMRGNWAPPASGTGRLASAPDRITRAKADSSSGLVCEWFEDGPSIEVVEEAKGLGSYGRVLTLLHAPELPGTGDLDSDH